MALRNPSINPPLLSSSARPRLHSRSPSHSPIRQPRDFDPLLRDLSPTTTLRAFSAADDSASRHDSAQSALAHSFETASTSERALGVKAAQTGLDLRSWTRELESWSAEWTGTFEVPELARKRMRMSGMSMLSARTVGKEGEEEGQEEYWGSLPGKMMQAYERRAEEIGQEVERLDVEELKVFVLSAHGQVGEEKLDGEGGIGGIGAHTDLRRIDDFTALITATILQALPYLSRVHSLLDVWSIRLSVLRQTPSYLRDLKQARTDLDHGWAAIAVSPSSGSVSVSSPNFTRDNMYEMKNIIDQQVNSLGKRLDSFLDDLEGREETVPETWIGDFETLESAYGNWVVQAERKVLENEWRVAREEQEREVERAKAREALTGSQREGEPRVSSSFFDVEDHSRDRDSLVLPSSRPTSGAFDLPGEEPMLDFPRPFDEPREDSQTLPQSDIEQIQHPQGDSNLPASSPILQPPQVASPTKRHARHMPIVIDYSNPEQVHPSQPEQQASPLEGTQKENTHPSALSTSPLTNISKKRTAFSNGDVERAESLQRQVKSPVRSFEHASNAFTRLFRRDSREKTPEQLQSRSNSHRSTVSQNSSGSKRDSGGKRNSNKSTDGMIWGGRRYGSTGSPAVGETASASGSKRASLDPREAYSRSRSGSQRSSDFRGAMVDAVPIGLPRQKSFQRDYMDMPGGFRSRSNSNGSHMTARGSITPGRLDFDGLQKRLEGLPEVAAPVETYQPSGRRFSSPLRSLREENGNGDKAAKEGRGQQYPADWPLASPPETVAGSPIKEVPGAFLDDESVSAAADEQQDQDENDPDVDNLRAPLDTNAFDRIFVSSLPPTPEPEFGGNLLARLAAPPPSERRRSALGSIEEGSRDVKKNQVPTLDESMLGAEEDRWNASADAENSKSASSVIAGRSEREVQVGGYLNGEPEPLAPLRMSRTNSSTTARAQGRNGSTPTSPLPLKLVIPGSPSAVAASTNNDERLAKARPHLLHRASVASIESHPRSALRSIELPARHTSQNSAISVSAPVSSNQTPVDRSTTSAARRLPGSPTPLNYKDLIVLPTPPGFLADGDENGTRPDSPVSPISRPQSPGRTQHAGTPSEKRDHQHGSESPVSARSDNGDDSPAPLNTAMRKRQGKARPTTTRSAALSTSSNKRTKKPATPLKPGEDSFDRHVSDVLDRLPSQAIKFRPRPGAITPSHQRTSEPRNYSGPRPNGGSARVSSRTGADPPASTVGGGLTLAPAETSSRKSAAAAATAADEVKLYHLRQAGREEPIKLFVRLVGEGERVMVRVGGGWADLAEYLRQYAEHHGSRTVSGGGGVEVLNAGESGRKVSGSATNGAGSGSGEVGGRVRGTPVTPATGAGAARPGSSRAGEMNWFKLDDHSPSADNHHDNDDDDDDGRTQLKTPPHATTTTTTDLATPKSTTSTAATRPGSSRSRPSTADSTTRPNTNLARPNSRGQPQALRSANANKRSAAAGGDLPEQKARWVEGMIEKAKAASAEKKEGGEKGRGFGELGRVGGTRRMIFRQGSGTTGKGDGERG
ncbi:hypothetical protein B0A54_13541 [Friedmanniomyces endolithicus]|uniref:GAR domain-containing protein n=1 Tax=Friedmanniomyces endolithicus TaxID=329885 RepID=A0A4V5N6N1_9PEZI|nr:hypothetical protein LTS09_015725 [Friedmanniomyces endolithicus]TKA36539.1 hypothetical protein B0A54_13541 [Friedmanniomyces endolithicus]